MSYERFALLLVEFTSKSAKAKSRGEELVWREAARLLENALKALDEEEREKARVQAMNCGLHVADSAAGQGSKMVLIRYDNANDIFEAAAEAAADDIAHSLHLKGGGKK